jgi:signal peptidase I
MKKLLLLISVMAILFVSSYKLVFVSGISMETTIKNKHLGLLHKNTEIKEKDIICAEISSEKVIKRIVAVSGDTIQIKKGTIYKNDAPITQSNLVYPDMPLYKLLENEFFIIGDNYEVSEYYIINSNQIVGELIF